MPATRTQIYLQPLQRRRLDEIAGSRGLSLASVIREAVDLYLAKAPTGAAAALRNTFGVAPEASAPSRQEWNNREKRLWYRDRPRGEPSRRH